MAYVYYAGVVQPLDASPVILHFRARGDLRNLELLVLLGKLRRNVVEHVQNARLIHSFGIFADIIPVAIQYLPL